jgi:thiol-disulfide isomerase/thioredoxin
MLPQYPNDLELRAWYVVGANLSYSSDGLDAVVEGMKQSAPDSPWTLLASATLLRDQKEKLDLCEKAVASDGANPDVLVLATSLLQRASLIQSYAQHPPNADELKKFVTGHKAAYERSTNGLAAEAQALNTIATIEKDSNATAALELADRVLKDNPDNVTMLLLKSGALQKEEQYEAAFELLKAAAKGVPDSYALHMAYWDAVMALPDAKAADQKQEIEADATRIFSSVMPSTQIVQMALYKLDRNPPDLGTAIGDLILKKYPETAAEDAVFYCRANKDLPMAATDQNLDHKIKALGTFIDRPKHYDDNLLKDANGMLIYDMTSQKNPDLERLYQAIVTVGGTPQGVSVLADHKSHLPEIEKQATTQLDSEWTELQKAVKDWPEEELKGYMQHVLLHDSARWLDALGWVYFNEGKLEAALSKIEIASKLNPNDPECAIHLGRVYEARGDNARSGEIFKDALSKPYYGEGDHPAVAALRELYVHVHGSEAGLDAYMQPILEKDRARRKAVILGERLKPEKPIPPFTLASLNGKEVASEDLKGKLVIVNFWATWCGWCRREFPAFEKFYEKYKNNPEVVILAISTDARTTPDKVVEQFLTEHKYNFPVLRGYDYGTKAGVHGIPTNWFIDAHGNLAFQEVGYAPHLEEEFSWRLEAMRKSESVEATSKPK